MLVDYEYKSGKLIVSYVADSGNIQLKYYDWKRPLKFIVTDEFDPNAHPTYRSWDGRRVKAVPFDPNRKPLNRYAVYEFLDSLPETERNEIFGYKEPNIYFCDIETEIVDTGFVEPKDATTKVLSIALVHKSKTMILGIKPLHKQECYFIQDETNRRLEKFGIKYDVKYIDFSTYENPEFEMLNYFFEILMPKIPVITGWNFVNYDWMFLISRGKRLGVNVTKCSVTGNIPGLHPALDRNPTAQNDRWKNEVEVPLPAHRIVVDYMELFKKWDTSIKIRESYSLDFIAEKTLGGEGKVHYSGGLQTLYEQDYKMYLFYNLIDTILVQMIHEKMKYINILYAISALSKVRALDAYSALRVTEGLMRNDFRNLKNIVLCKDYETQITGDDGVLGGYVKDPNRGLNKWVACYDFASLYPTTQRQNNIAPENFMGIRIDSKHVDFNGRRKDYVEDDTITCTAGNENRAVFSREFSVTCNKLTEIYNDRKKFKKKMLQAKDELAELKKELEALESKV